MRHVTDKRYLGSALVASVATAALVVALTGGDGSDPDPVREAKFRPASEQEETTTTAEEVTPTSEEPVIVTIPSTTPPAPYIPPTTSLEQIVAEHENRITELEQTTTTQAPTTTLPLYPSTTASTILTPLDYDEG
jgi:hypothetical protein